MNNKKSLILLALVLFLVSISLIIYAFNSNKKEETLSEIPLKIKEKEVEKTETKDQNLEKIKTQMEKLNNQSLEVKEKTTSDETSQGVAEAKKYEEDFIKKGQAQMADGLVLEKTADYLKVKFSSASYTWISKVNINSKTSITKLNSGSENISIPLAEIDLNSKVVVRTTGASITEEEFDAERVIKVY